jgi:pimeloyl-ACP methyl ester carboxylesterase
VVGGRSAVFDAEELRHARTLPGATVDVLEAAGHWIHVDDLEGTVRAVIDRLATGPPS